MAVWPRMYHREEWCESNISGQVYTLSFLPSVVTQCSFHIQFEKETYTSRQFLSYVFSQDSWLSAKDMFRRKIQSEIIDFASNFELLSFQFDFWLYKTVSGLQMTLPLLWISWIFYITISIQKHRQGNHT